MTDDVAAARRAYAEELRFAARIRSPALVAAFAAVPRERFLGPGPWRVKSPADLSEYWTTDDADRRSVYHDVLIALDEARGINNGAPRLWAYLLDQLHVTPGEHVLHLGCGTGYYTAIMAELVSPMGKITGIDVDAMLAEKARMALARWPQVAVSQADASGGRFDLVDIVVVSAGATHPLPAWVDALKPGGRLLVPLTAQESWGGMLLVHRDDAETYAARFPRPRALSLAPARATRRSASSSPRPSLVIAANPSNHCAAMPMRRARPAGSTARTGAFQQSITRRSAFDAPPPHPPIASRWAPPSPTGGEGPGSRRASAHLNRGVYRWRLEYWLGQGRS